MLEIKRPLILGSSGVVGAALLDYYSNQGDSVSPIQFDRTLDHNMDLTAGPDTVWEYVDVSDFVFFLAYDVGGAKFLDKNKNNISLIQNNCRIMDNVFEVLKETKKPFIFASSQMSNMLHSSYGVCKALGEHYTNALGGKFVRFWNVYGPEHDEEKAHVITDFINNALKTKQINMLTDGNEKRQFLHTDDCSKCLATLANTYDEIPADEPLDITTFNWNTIRDIADIVSNNIPGTTVTPGERKDMTQRDMQNNPDRSILKYWKPEISLEVGIKQLVELYKKDHE
tara:strand:- start:7874 stop:8725 length:852 start_codon:yes stop_codon:yes gene_type:complete